MAVYKSKSSSETENIGFILGTGTNTAYVERNSNITKLKNLDPAGSMIINAGKRIFLLRRR